MENYSVFKMPEQSDWVCDMFGAYLTDENGTNHSTIQLRPVKGAEPNWFWRMMQYLILGNRWRKL